ncbi:hypothetical protein I6F15_14885 [Bradyrhizobium sp. BRP14]|nr:hypothetical protein [Bradyrhizobium sp. BRP14]
MPRILAAAIIELDHLAGGNVACTYSQLGDFEQAIDILEKIVPLMGREQQQWMKNDSDLEPLRGHPRYQKLMKAVG